LLGLKKGLPLATQLQGVLPDVGIHVAPPNTSSFAKVLEGALAKYREDYYSGEFTPTSVLASITSNTAWENLEKAGVVGLYFSSSNVELMKKALTGGTLGPTEKGKVAAALSLSLAEPDTPQRKNGAETGTLQPPPLGLGCAHRPVLC
jgi:hypothetical protein